MLSSAHYTRISRIWQDILRQDILRQDILRKRGWAKPTGKGECIHFYRRAIIQSLLSPTLIFLLFRVESARIPVKSINFETMFNRAVSNLLFLCLFCFSLPLLSGCANKAGAGPAGAGAAPKTEVIVDSVGMEDVQIYIYADGRTVASNSVEIRARVSGYLEELFFEPGAIVKEGDRLALIEQATYQVALDVAKAELSNAQAQAALAEANLERSRILLERGAGTTEDFQTQRATYDVALAGIERANAAIRNAELNLQYTDMRAPISGKTTKNLVDIGNYVSPTGSQAVLLSITQLDPMYVEFKLNDRQYSDLKDRSGFRDAFTTAMNASEGNIPTEGSSSQQLALTGIPVDVSLQTGVNVFSFDFNIPGKTVTLVDNQINFATASVTLRAEIRNPLLRIEGAEDYLIYAGQVCRVRIPYEKVENAILVREEAILTDLDTKYVLVVDKGMYQPKDPSGKPITGPDGEPIPAYETDLIHRRDITLGRLLDSQKRIVLNGLQPGETYVVQGVQRARVGTEVQPTTLEDYNARRRAAESGSTR